MKNNLDKIQTGKRYVNNKDENITAIPMTIAVNSENENPLVIVNILRKRIIYMTIESFLNEFSIKF